MIATHHTPPVKSETISSENKKRTPRRSKTSRPKTEALSLRLNPKKKFAIEFVSRVSGRSITTLVELAIESFASKFTLQDEMGENETWLNYWHISEGVRKIKILTNDRLRTTFEDEELYQFLRFHPEFFTNNNVLWMPDFIKVDILWPKIEEYLEVWREKSQKGPWAAGHLMVKALSVAEIEPPDWPRSSTEPPKPKPTLLPTSPGGHLDDDVPF